VKVKKKMEVEVYVCDFCGKESFLELDKCFLCGRDICKNCNATYDLSWRARYVYLCPECCEKATVKEVIEKLRKAYRG